MSVLISKAVTHSVLPHRNGYRMEHRKHFGVEKSFGFGLRALKSHPELIPIAAIVCFAATGICAFSYYSLLKSDVIIDKSKSPPWERIDPEKPQKLLTVTQQWKKIPELEELKKELGDRKP